MSDSDTIVRLIPFAANRNQPLGQQPPFNPCTRLAYVEYLNAFNRLNRNLTSLYEILFLHKDICAEIAKLGAPDSKLSQYTADCAAWADAIDHMLARDPGDWHGAMAESPRIVLCHCEPEPGTGSP